MKQEKISIIIPVYNSEKYLKKCLDSVFSQSYNNIEVIVVNDGSTDNSDIICKKYIGKKNMIYKRIQHSGAPTARNIGLSMANGIFIIFFDSDDHLQPNAMESMYNKMKDEKADIVIGKSYIINETGKKLGIQNLYLCRNLTSQAYSYFLIDPFPGNKLYKMELIKKNSLLFSDIKIGQDLNFFLKYLIFTKKISFLEEFVSSYRLVSTSISRTYDLRILDIVKSLEDVEAFYKKNSCYTQYIKALNSAKVFHYMGQLSKIKNYNRNDKILIYNNLVKKINLIIKNNYFSKKYILKISITKIKYFFISYL